MKILHMHKQWIPGPSFFFPACLPAREKRGTGDEAIVSPAERTKDEVCTSLCGCGSHFIVMSTLHREC